MGNRASYPLPLLHVRKVAAVFGPSWSPKNSFLSRVKDLPGEGRVQNRMTLFLTGRETNKKRQLLQRMKYIKIYYFENKV